MTNLITTISRERLEDMASGNWPDFGFYDDVKTIARALLAVMDAKPAPAWGQSRFKGGDWASCSAEHAAMVMANPEEWGDYECRYLYTTPPATIVPDGWKLVPVELSLEMYTAWMNSFEGAFGDWKAMLEAAPAPGGE